MKNEIIILLAGTYSLIVTVLFSALVVAAIREPTILTLTGILVGSGFFLPVKFFYENFEDLYENVHDQIMGEKYTIGLSSVLFVISWIGFTRGIVYPGSNILNLSFHASAQIFFPVQSLIYTSAGQTLADISFDLSRWLLQFMYIYLVTGLIVDVLNKIRTFSDSLLPDSFDVT